MVFNLIASAIPSVLGSIIGASAEKKAAQAGMQLTREQIAEARRQFDAIFGENNQRFDELTDLSREDYDNRSNEASDLRAFIESLLESQLPGLSSLDATKEGGAYDIGAGATDGAIQRELLNRVVGDAQEQRGLARSAAAQLPGFEQQLRERGPSASVLSALINRRAQGELADEFAQSREAGSRAMARTGKDNSKFYAEMAARQGKERAKTAVDSELAGITGAEQLAGSRAARLSPIVNSLAGRAGASPSAGLPEDATATRNAQMMATILGNRTSLTGNLASAHNVQAGGMAFPQAGVGTSSPVMYGGNVQSNTPNAPNYGGVIAGAGNLVDALFKRKADGGVP